jgi:hypothetical protein
MTRITAANNITIEMEADRWRLLYTTSDQERELVDIVYGQPVKYGEAFASKRRLPEAGSLPASDIQRVVLGWSTDDQSWHLGLLLGDALAQGRGSRWCEMARWPDADTTLLRDSALLAGRALARVLGHPFNLIEPEVVPKPIPIQPPPPLRSLPLEFDEWSLENQDTVSLVRSPRWARSQVLRTIWYAALVVIYFVLGILSLQNLIALPRPEFLPYLGIAVGVLLIGLLLYTVYRLFTHVNRIAISSSAVSGMHGNQVRWRIERNQVQAVYVSEIINRKNKRSVIQHGELNLYLQDGSFKNLLIQPHSTEDDHLNGLVLPDDGIHTLTLYNATTDLQMAALHMAQNLNVECRYDIRAR